MVMCRVLFGTLEGELCLLEVMRCVLFCTLEGVEGRIYLLEMEVLGVMLRVLLGMPKGRRGYVLRAGGSGRYPMFAEVWISCAAWYSACQTP